MSRRRYAVVGTGGRATMYVDAVLGTYADTSALVGLCDTSRQRMAFHNARAAHKFGVDPVPEYHADRFDDLVAEQRPDVVIVTSVDATHHLYITRALDLGCDVLTEKPMTTTAEGAGQILAALERSGRQLRVGFNYRYAPGYSMVRQLVAEGAVGRPHLVDFEWTLDTFHGADYFRRWHREKASSGGLLVHKASHHFDLVDWWVSSWPQQVFATGGLRFYGDEAAAGRGERYAYERYTGVEEAKDDPFAFDLTWARGLRGLYLEAEEESGYRRDQNVFAPGVTIEDTVSIAARYRSGTSLSYSLVAYSPTEGMRVAITGDRGRLELVERHRSHVVGGEGLVPGASADEPSQTLVVQPMFGPATEIEIPHATGDHGGGDERMLEDLFSPDPPPDPLGRAASYRDGAAALLLGLAANRSLETGQAVDCDDVLRLA